MNERHEEATLRDFRQRAGLGQHETPDLGHPRGVSPPLYTSDVDKLKMECQRLYQEVVGLQHPPMVMGPDGIPHRLGEVSRLERIAFPIYLEFLRSTRPGIFQDIAAEAVEAATAFCGALEEVQSIAQVKPCIISKTDFGPGMERKR